MFVSPVKSFCDHDLFLIIRFSFLISIFTFLFNIMVVGKVLHKYSKRKKSGQYVWIISVRDFSCKVSADTSHDCLKGGGGEKSKFSDDNTSTITATTTFVGAYVKVMHYMTDLTPQ